MQVLILSNGAEITPACAAANPRPFSFPAKIRILLLLFWLLLPRKKQNKTKHVSVLYQHLSYCLPIAYELIAVIETHVVTEQLVLTYFLSSWLFLQWVRKAPT